MRLQAYLAERVKVVVRVRPPHESETSGGLEIDDDEKSVTLQRRFFFLVLVSDVLGGPS